MIFGRRRNKRSRVQDEDAATAGADELDRDGADPDDLDDADAGDHDPDDDLDADGLDADDLDADDVEADEEGADLDDDPEVRPGGTVATGRDDGPWDATEGAPDAERHDFGALRVPVSGDVSIEVRIENDTVVSANVVREESMLELMLFAAPKSGGIWEDVRGEMIKALKENGGRVSSVEGTFGRELVAEVPAQGPEGQEAVQKVRFVGVDGPRWFLRAGFYGRASDEPRHAAPLEEVLRGIVVDRGDEAMAPREIVPLTLSRQDREALGLVRGDDEPVYRFRNPRARGTS